MNRQFHRLSTKYKSLGATFEQDDVTIRASLPRGKVFRDNSKSFLVVQYATIMEEFMGVAVKEMEKSLALGVRDADKDELSEYDHSNGTNQ